MFIPCDNNKLIHSGNITYVWLSDDGALRAINRDGETFLIPDCDLETIETMGCPTVQAGDGYVKLFFSFTDRDSFEEHPVLAWRLRTPYAPEAISLFDDQFVPPGLTAVRYPDGRIMVMDADENTPTIADTKAWKNYASQERLKWLRNGENNK
jgi:hypothetical protein